MGDIPATLFITEQDQCLRQNSDMLVLMSIFGCKVLDLCLIIPITEEKHRKVMQMKPSIYGKNMNNKVIQSTIINSLKLY